jgi:hypothetical protein
MEFLITLGSSCKVVPTDSKLCDYYWERTFLSNNLDIKPIL